jgi:hypothetical protein
MNKYNFQDWLKTKVSDDSEVILAGKLEYLRLYLTDAMRETANQGRTNAGTVSSRIGSAASCGVQARVGSKGS